LELAGSSSSNIAADPHVECGGSVATTCRSSKPPQITLLTVGRMVFFYDAFYSKSTDLIPVTAGMKIYNNRFEFEECHLLGYYSAWLL
jgi:hypothetical protein